MEGGLELDQLATGHQRVERRLLQGDADLPPHLRRLLDDVVARDACGPAGRPQERRQHPDGGRLPGPVRAEEGVDLALRDLEVDPLDGLDFVPEAPFEARYLYCSQAWESTRRRHRGLRYASPCGYRNLARERVFPASHGRTTYKPSLADRRGPARRAGGVGCSTPPAPTPRASARPRATPTASCPKTPCQAVGRTTVIQLVADGRRGVFKARQNGKVVAWALSLSQPNQEQLDFFGDFYASQALGTRPTARIAVVKRKGDGREYKLKGQSAVIDLTSSLDSYQVFTLTDPIPIRKRRVPRADDPDLVAVVRDRAQPDEQHLAGEPDRRQRALRLGGHDQGRQAAAEGRFDARLRMRLLDGPRPLLGLLRAQANNGPRLRRDATLYWPRPFYSRLSPAPPHPDFGERRAFRHRRVVFRHRSGRSARNRPSMTRLSRLWTGNSVATRRAATRPFRR